MISRNKPTIKTTTPKKPNKPVKAPNAVLVRVKYRNKAPMIASRTPINFSDSDTQNVSPSLMPCSVLFLF